MAWQFKSDWVTTPRNPTYQDLQNLMLDQGRAGFGAWGGNVDAGGYVLGNLGGVNITSNLGSGCLHVTNTTNVLGLDVGLLAGGADPTAYLFQRANAHLIIGTNNTERIRITSGGNVGIGTASPAAVLHCARAVDDGAALLRLSLGAGFGYNFSRSPASGWLLIQGDQAGNNGFSFLSNAGVSRFSIDGATGYVKHTATPVCADNAAAVAAGLTAGTMYRTPTGDLREVY